MKTSYSILLFLILPVIYAQNLLVDIVHVRPKMTTPHNIYDLVVHNYTIANPQLPLIVSAGDIYKTPSKVIICNHLIGRDFWFLLIQPVT